MVDKDELPEEPWFCPEDITDICDQIREEHHPELNGARIRYMFCPALPKSNGDIVLGRAKKLSGWKRVAIRADFVIRFNFECWEELDQDQRRALIDHELSHCGCKDPTELPKDREWMIRNHDAECFVDVIDRHGVWTDGIQSFVDGLKQVKLFESAEVTVSK